MKRMRHLLSVLWFAALVVSCQGGEPSKDLDARRTEIAADLFSTQTAQQPTPSITPSPTSTPIPSPTSSPTPTFTPTPVYPVLAHTPLPYVSRTISIDNVDEIEALAIWGKGEAYQAAFSPDGDLLAVASSLGIYFYQSQDLSLERFIPMRSPALSIAFSPDGWLLAAGTEEETLLLWDAIDGSLTHQFTTDFEYSAPIHSVAFSPDGYRLAAGGYGGVALINPQNGEQTALLGTRSASITSLAFSHDGKRLAVGTDAGDISIWDVEDEAILQTMGHADEVTKLTFSLDDQFLASCGTDARIWEVESGKLAHQIEGNGCGISFSPLSNILAVGSSVYGPPVEAKIEYFQTGDWDPTKTWDLGQGTFRDLGNSPDEKILFAMVDVNVSSRSYQVLQVWTEEGLQGWASHNQPVVSLDFTQDGRYLLAGFQEGAIWLHQTEDGTLQRILRPIDETPEDLLQSYWAYGLTRAFLSLDDQTIYSTFHDGTLGFANLFGELAYTTVGWDEEPDGEALSPDGQIVAAGESFMLGSSDISLWHSTGGESYQTLEEGISASLLTFSPDGTYLATNQGMMGASFSGKGGLIFQLPDGTLLHELEMEGTPSVLLFSPDSSRLAVATSEYWVYLWDVESGDLIFTLDADQRSEDRQPPNLAPPAGSLLGINCLDFSPDGTLLAVGTEYGSVQFWDLDDGSFILEDPYPLSLRIDDPHISPIWNSAVSVMSLAFSDDGSILAVGGLDGRIELWGIPGG